MKKILFAVGAALCLVTAIGVAKDLTEEEMKTEKVYDVPGFKRDQIFTSSRMWIAENFRSAKAVIEYENKDEGTIIGNGNIKYPCKNIECLAKADWRVSFTMRVDTKDDKFRLTFTNVHLTWPAQYLNGVATPAADLPVKRASDMDKIRPKLLELGDSIQAAVTKGAASNDW